MTGTIFALTVGTIMFRRHSRTLLIVLAAALLVGGCGAIGNSDDGNPVTPSPPPTSGSVVVYAAIGASDAAGVGSSAPCIPFTDCPDGMGYVPVIARQLKGLGATVTLSNLGIPGAVLGPSVQALGNQMGRGIPGNFLDQEVPFVPKNATVVTIFAGGNDTNTIAAAVERGIGDASGYVDQQIRTFGTDFASMLKTIKERAPAARVVIANLPNFAVMPFTRGYSRDQRLLVQRISVGISTQVINPLAAQGHSVVDLLCDSRFASGSIYSSDGFHPNDYGYSVLAGEMVKAITSSSYPAPQSSCGLMTAQ